MYKLQCAVTNCSVRYERALTKVTFNLLYGLGLGKAQLLEIIEWETTFHLTQQQKYNSRTDSENTIRPIYFYDNPTKIRNSRK